MSLLKKIRNQEMYFEKIQTLAEGTQYHIQHSISDFENFCMEKFGKSNIIPDLKKADEQEVFDILQLWINWSKHLKPKTISNRFSAINTYLHYMGIKLNDRDIKQELTFPTNIEEELHGVTLDELQKLLPTMQYKKRTMFICQLSGLMRVGEMVQLRKRHVTDLGHNMMIKIPAIMTKSKKGRTTFWSKEASRLVRPILKKLDDDDLIFQKNVHFHNAVIAVEQVMRRGLQRVGLDQRYESTNRFLINTHSLRAYGITKISRHDPNFAKKIAGQKGYLLQYDRQTDEEKLETYRKYEIDLLIDKDAIQKAEIQRLTKENLDIKKTVAIEVREALYKERNLKSLVSTSS
jgi:hypothetical protein